MKDWFKSKTIWVNLGIAVLGWLANAAQTMPIKPEYQMVVVGIVNMALRLVTTQPISGSPAA